MITTYHQHDDGVLLPRRIVHSYHQTSLLYKTDRVVEAGVCCVTREEIGRALLLVGLRNISSAQTGICHRPYDFVDLSSQCGSVAAALLGWLGAENVQIHHLILPVPQSLFQGLLVLLDELSTPLLRRC